MTPQSIAYVAYLAASVYVTVVVGRRLHQRGCPFLDDIFPDRLDVGYAVNNLLLTGYYLVNIAFAALLLRNSGELSVGLDALVWCSGRLGIVLTSLGLMHFTNVAVLLLVHRWIQSRPRSGATNDQTDARERGC